MGSSIENSSVSVIIPTLGRPAREKLLERAIDSVIRQNGVRTIPIVVLNGQEADPEVARRLRSDPRLRLIRLEEPSLPDSLLAGRNAVDTPWFSELDDDDVLLPGALALRVRSLLDSPVHEVVVTNGYRSGSGNRILHVERMDQVREDPLRALTVQNWLLPGSWLCRTDAAEPSLFHRIPPFRECTFLALQFGLNLRVLFLQEPTVVWNTDTIDSASRLPDYLLAGPDSIQRILELALPPTIRAVFQRRMSEAHHSLARWHQSEGRTSEAWRNHIQSLRWPGGWRNLPFTGRLILGERAPKPETPESTSTRASPEEK